MMRGRVIFLHQERKGRKATGVSLWRSLRSSCEKSLIRSGIDIGKVLYAFELGQRLFVVAHEQECRAVFSTDFADERERFFRARAVEAAGGFVRQHELR